MLADFFPMIDSAANRVPVARPSRAALSSAARNAIELLEARQLLTSVLGVGLGYLTAPQQVVYGLDSDVSADLSLDDFVLDNLSTNSTIARSTESLSYIGSNGWSIQFPGQSGSGVTGMQQSRPQISASAAAEKEHR